MSCLIFATVSWWAHIVIDPDHVLPGDNRANNQKTAD
jgi:hypothetical protein